MACPPVRLLRPCALQVETTTPCILEVNIPIPLPYRLDPALPAPPYILDDRNDKDNSEGNGEDTGSENENDNGNGNGNESGNENGNENDNDNENKNGNENDNHNGNGDNELPISPEVFREIHVQPLVRRLLPQIAGQLFGSDANGSGPDPNQLGQLLSSWDASISRDKYEDFDIAGRGWWRDHLGVKHPGTVHAYSEFANGIQVMRAFRFYLVRGVADAAALRASNPRVLRLDVVDGDVDGCGWTQLQGGGGGNVWGEGVYRDYEGDVCESGCRVVDGGS